MFTISFDQTSLTQEQRQRLHQMWLRCMRRIIVSTTLAGSGHPGGSMSSLHVLLMLYSTLRHRPDDPCWEDRDRLLVSMGHISPGVYSVLCEFGYTKEDNMLVEFRRAGSSFAGHVECCVPGVEWNTGNLGQGLSVGTGMALALKLRNNPARVGVLMGDGEQQKGQIGEARRFAIKYELNNLFGIIDRNHMQIGGSTNHVMPQTIRAEYVGSQWNVIYLEDGHDFEGIFQALKRIHTGEVDDPRYPSVLVARTTMGKGVSFMENKAKYHGSTLTVEEASRALEELGIENDLAEYHKKRSNLVTFAEEFCAPTRYPTIQVGEPKTYNPATLTDNRSAYGAVLEDLARLNNAGAVPAVLGFSCDLEGSVKMGGFRKINESAFFEAGIQEHHTATMAGAVSKEGFTVFFSTFGVFGVDEVYNQQRLNDINRTQLKVVCTHLGLDVGEDGQTHQCIDYIGLLQNLFDFSVFIAADPNQTDRIARYIAGHPGNFFLGMGRSKIPVITDQAGNPFYAGSYRFEPGKADWLREGNQGAILSYGTTLQFALQAQNELTEKHGLQLAVVNCASIKPLDIEAVLKAADCGFVMTVEDHHADTGLGARVANVVTAHRIACRVIRLGVQHYGVSGKPSVLYQMEGIDSKGIVKTVLEAHANGWLGEK
ncbi:transketolase [Desulfoferrobacter suflitae]|uniref:transketolase n=1 Tax=Desulfoferrobacter suflitae TaxID=2865782 RepID=UPI002164D832|nr:transketolase [Desulfoferrobacter suflitae]MCK8601051.1 transketolase [Desulfoferrobacter suflitae]